MNNYLWGLFLAKIMFSGNFIWSRILLGVMTPQSDVEKTQPALSGYRVIENGRLSDTTRKIRDLSGILDHWDLYTENREDPVLDEPIPTARIGSAYTQSSPILTLRQLFGMWRTGKGVHSCFYDETGETVTEPLYMVGMGKSVLSGAFVYWGVVPSLHLILISNWSPETGKFGMRSNFLRYQNASQGIFE